MCWHPVGIHKYSKKLGWLVKTERFILTPFHSSCEFFSCVAVNRDTPSELHSRDRGGTFLACTHWLVATFCAEQGWRGALWPDAVWFWPSPFHMTCSRGSDRNQPQRTRPGIHVYHVSWYIATIHVITVCFHWTKLMREKDFEWIRLCILISRVTDHFLIHLPQ
jgi:hypothetical protein